MGFSLRRRARFHKLTAEHISAWGYIAGWKIVAHLPEALSVALFNLGADLASDYGRKPEQLRKNLSRVVGPENVTRQLVRQSMRSYMRYWREAFRLPMMAGPELADILHNSFDPGSAEKIAASRQRGQGTILVLPHAGNWDMAGMWLVHQHGTFTTVAERLKPEELFQAFVDYRTSLGFDVIALTGHDQPPMERMTEVLRAGGIVCLMGERDLSGRGVPVTFFNELTTMPVGAAKLAQDTGADVMVARVNFTGGSSPRNTGENEGWQFGVSDPLNTTQDLPGLVQDIATLFEENIRRDPTDWHMLQPMWFADLNERQRVRVQNSLDSSKKNPEDTEKDTEKVEDIAGASVSITRKGV